MIIFKTIACISIAGLAISIFAIEAEAQPPSTPAFTSEQIKATHDEIQAYGDDIMRLDKEEYDVYLLFMKARDAKDRLESCKMAHQEGEVLKKKLARMDLAKSRLAPIGVDTSSIVSLRKEGQDHLALVSTFMKSNCDGYITFAN